MRWCVVGIGVGGEEVVSESGEGVVDVVSVALGDDESCGSECVGVC